MWLIGLTINFTQGYATQYLTNYQLALPLLGTGLISLVGVYSMQPELKKAFISFRPSLDLDNSQYAKFSDRVDRYCYAFLPIFLSATAMFFFISGGINFLWVTSINIATIWNFFIVFFIDLLSITGIWIGVSIWIVIFQISRQRLKVDLSHDIVSKFRKLTTLALWFSLVYFISVSLGIVLPLSVMQITAFDAVMYPLITFIIIGVASIMLPFYNIHNALVSLKRKELKRIEDEFKMLQANFEEANFGTSNQLTDKSIQLMRIFFSLQLRERQVRLAQEWPIDITFLSKLFLLVLIPVIVRITTWIIMGLT